MRKRVESVVLWTWGAATIAVMLYDAWREKRVRQSQTPPAPHPADA